MSRLKILAEADFMEEMIKGRQKQINQIEGIMIGVNELAKELNMETKS